MDVVLQQLVNGLLRGGTYAVVGSGFAITYGVSRILNFAHGAFFVIGSYSVFALYDWLSLPLATAFVIGPLVVLPVAVFSYWVVVRPYQDGGHTALLGSFALAIAYLEILRIVFGGRALLLPRLIDTSPISLGDRVFVAVDSLVVFGVSLVILAAILVTLQRTGVGRRLRATVQSREAASLIGIDAEPYRLLSFVMGAFLAAMAGAGIALLAPITGTAGIRMTFVSFVIVIIAGFGNITGAVITGFLVALAEAMSTLYVPSEFAVAAPFVLMVAVLIVRPTGLFPRRA